jgi:hypothetical protein
LPAPVHPGRGHPDTLVSQIFNVRDNQRNPYLVGWQIVPYQGARTYSFGTGGNLLALEPPTGGKPLGFGIGTVTFSGNADAGTVHALVKLRAGGTLNVTGNWVDCHLCWGRTGNGDRLSAAVRRGQTA